MIRFSAGDNPPGLDVFETNRNSKVTNELVRNPMESMVFNDSRDSKEEKKVPVRVELTPQEPDQIIVKWEPGEPENPLNWSRARRWYITLWSSTLVLNATFTSTIPSGMTREIMEHFTFSREVAILNLSLFVAGYCVGPLLWGPLSEQYGRRPVFVGTFFFYSVFQVGNAVAPNTAAMLIFRLLGGTFAAAPLANSGAVMGDIWDAGTRGNALALFTLAPFAGPAIGPTISGYMSNAGVSWRWIFWLTAIFAFVCTVITFFTLPETYTPVLLVRKAERLRKETGDQRYVAPMELVEVPLKQRLENITLKPFRILISEPMLIALTIYMSFVFGCIYLLFEAYPVVFAVGHRFNPGASGLTLLNIPVGGSVAVIVYLKVVNPRYRKKVEKYAPAPVPPEVRLEMALIGGPMLAASFFWFGWTSYPGIPWIVPVIAGGFQGFSICFLFMSLINYIIDAYLAVAASALAASTVIRSLTGAAFPLFATQMYETLNPRWASSLVGFIALGLTPIPFVLIKYGPRLRLHSKYAPSRVPVTVAPVQIPLQDMSPRDEKKPSIEGNGRPLSQGGSIHSIQQPARSVRSSTRSSYRRSADYINITLTGPQMAKLAQIA